MPAGVLTHGKLFIPDNEREAMEDNLTLAKPSCNKADVKRDPQAAPCYPVGTVAQQQEAGRNLGRNHDCLGEAGASAPSTRAVAASSTSYAAGI